MAFTLKCLEIRLNTLLLDGLVYATADFEESAMYNSYISEMITKIDFLN